MELKYKGPLKLDQVIAKAVVTDTRADVTSEYHFRNPTRKPCAQKVNVIGKGISKLGIRKPTDLRSVSAWANNKNVKILNIKRLNTIMPPLSNRIVDIDFSIPLNIEKVRHFQYVPNLNLNNRQICDKVSRYSVTIELPPEARHIVKTSVPPTRVTKNDGKMVCVFDINDTYLIPISIKWTALDVNVKLSKSIRQIAGNKLQITVNIRNNGKKAVKNIQLQDEYSEMQASIPKNETKIKKIAPFDKSTRVVWRTKCSLAAKEKKTFKYSVIGQGSGVSIPPTIATVNNQIVGIADAPLFFPSPAPAFSRNTAFALPSGWSFDYLHGDDHHINEHGMWCTGQNYDSRQQRLTWSTGCIYADKNFDDDYRWSVATQVVRFTSGVGIHRDTPWLAKTGNTTTHNDEFTHEDLKKFDNAIVLIRGWRFDFTSEDHHINKISLRIENVSFNKNAGQVRWRTRVTYADKNFDDNYRYQYQYTILGFNGRAVFKSFSGTDKGGSMVHNGEVTDATLKNFQNTIVFPVGWSFDYKSEDHHVNEHSFNIQNIRYNKNAGRVSWISHLKYCDKNSDDDYYWAYDVVVIATDAGESRTVGHGPYTDGGGLDSKLYAVDLNATFIPVTWENGVKDGTETGVDCGGNSPARDMISCRNVIDPGNGPSSDLFSLKSASQRNVVITFATVALLEYAQINNVDFDTFYSGAEKADRYVEAIASYVDRHMTYVSDGLFGGSQSAFETLTDTGHRSSNDFAGDCEDHAILRAALLRSLGFYKGSIFCADHHNSVDQGQDDECYGDKKGSGGHTFNIVVYKGKYRILDYGPMQCRYWSNKSAWKQNVVDNIWNDHTGKHWSRQDVSPFDSPNPLVNYPGNPCSPSANWDWRTYFCDITL